MQKVRAKKHLGQHFLKDEGIAKTIASSLSGDFPSVLEIGPGMGVLTKYLIIDPKIKELKVVEIDNESVEFLNSNFPSLSNNIISEDFLKMNLENLFPNPFAIIGNFPYNISNQILFKVFENRDKVVEVVGMFQKEVAERVSSKSGNKVYGILSVLLSVYFDIEYLFTVDENVFIPPPKVKSAVIRLRRNKVEKLDCDEKLFVRIVKTAFNQRRKMLRQALKPLGVSLENIDQELMTKRAEQLSVEQFIGITNSIKQTI
ncbi:MAG: 16S rRNA (adenine(1518)-N(6)/adenine(1519)-N(6))-dimethyltransferase RsmA [Bacteroidales bacterium]|nr:16S rRNA (adenine(1518)-N(6)/adenine(1519)-N(6))-dimethyltransferase RsmA [Bacteroidales bacterium]